MPPPQYPHRQHHRRKLQRPKERLMTTRKTPHPLRRLRQPKARAQIYKQATHHHRSRIPHHAPLPRRHRRFPRLTDEDEQEEQE